MSDPKQDLEYLRLLSIFHYVVGGLTALFACLPLIHLFMGIALLVSGLRASANDPAASIMGCFFIGFSASFILAGWGLAACLVLAGRFLESRKHYNFCLVVAAVACVVMPFGTVLGVFTIIVLVRESVKELFRQSAEGAAPRPAGAGA